MNMRGTNVKKREIKTAKRTGAVVLILLAALAGASAALVCGIMEIQTEKTVQAASLTTKSEIQCEMTLREDPYYNRESLEFGSGYIAKYVESAALDFSYAFNCAEAAEVSGIYTVTALLQATYNEKDLVWTKSFNIIPQTGFRAKDSRASAQLPLKEYLDWVKNIEDSTGVNTVVVLTVTYTVNADAEIAGERISDSSEATLTIPLTGEVLVMGGTPVAEQTRAVETRIMKSLLPQKAALLGGGTVFAAALAALIWLLVYTCGVRPDPVKLELERIYKKYGSRIVELRPDAHTDTRDAVPVNAFKDLLLTADELKKPIFKGEGTDGAGAEFYVFDSPNAFMFRFEAAVTPQDEQQPDAALVASS